METKIKVSTLKAIAMFSALKDIRYYLKGAYVQAKDGIYRITASDGHTLATSTWLEDPGPEFDVIIPKETLDLVLKACGKSEHITLAKDGETWSLANIPFTPLDGRYPDTQRVWPDAEKMDGKPCLLNPEYYARLGKIAKSEGVGYEGIQQWWSDSLFLFQVGAIRGIIMPLRGDINKNERPCY